MMEDIKESEVVGCRINDACDRLVGWWFQEDWQRDQILPSGRKLFFAYVQRALCRC